MMEDVVSGGPPVWVSIVSLVQLLLLVWFAVVILLLGLD